MLARIKIILLNLVARHFERKRQGADENGGQRIGTVFIECQTGNDSVQDMGIRMQSLFLNPQPSSTARISGQLIRMPIS